MARFTDSVKIETPAGTFGSPAEAADAGYPIACQAFVTCENHATTILAHPVLTAVLACERCATRLED